MEWNGGGEMEERMSIRDSSKALKKYGSTAKHMTRNENLVKHVVSASDTLQGIALKYGVTTEQIRRANRLWASDSLFLREYLLIPVPGDINASLGNYSILPSGAESSQGIESITSPSSITSSIDDESSVDDFLAKMDSSIASMKKEVKRAQGNILENMRFAMRGMTRSRSGEEPLLDYATHTPLVQPQTHQPNPLSY
ncbi:lysM and putative peptidoglycan-binding domain-containing protein 2 isoform X4 [Neodiprion virginianus]|uniref:LysM and putative peptidoglycan-binding domain-containing protein 2 isoform X4 n=2 Tax=Neodiprion TaxID=270857 RepID=A0A6J0BX26_NEOLC|nr:lysM and putative peptidoglycan-binding domain-containing protein 2 isoform X4 [Neodiprion lecontei]XP_046423749.1 lysM and putative peptidoglycan-binding domain-containing protein 2 isoform X4 [Neodiprion fabricii]XP_046479190.1 lysM and putative peptidoglycan-binding domain-containing protein 2 isoform X4 [Neodiprion pinetum]XP_046617418.1 lysM and putative peptidoglycan-binding domain-containing protein 2 isoform X4 [Neodiprion virginianus]